jgi:hypothetical protein
MKIKIDDIIKSPKDRSCNNCIFCFSKCLKCGSHDIIVEYRTFFRYKYRNKYKDHIYVTKLKKRSKSYAPLLKIDCNKCKNKITAIGEINGIDGVRYLRSYTRDNRRKNFKSNSKYYRQAKYLFDKMERLYMMPTGVGNKMSCDSLHIFIDGIKTKIREPKRHFIKVEWFSNYWQNIIYTTNNFGYKKNPGRLKYMMKLKDKPALGTMNKQSHP